MMPAMNKRGGLLMLKDTVVVLTFLCLPLAWAANTSAPADADPQLLGCWRAERVEQTLADGHVWTDVGGCRCRSKWARSPTCKAAATKNGRAAMAAW
jgi:hypothetical protein